MASETSVLLRLHSMLFLISPLPRPYMPIYNLLPGTPSCPIHKGQGFRTFCLDPAHTGHGFRHSFFPCPHMPIYGMLAGSTCLALPTLYVVSEITPFLQLLCPYMMWLLELLVLLRPDRAWFLKSLPFPVSLCPYMKLYGTNSLTHTCTHIFSAL